MDSKFKALSDIALQEAKHGGCSYADIRFTRATNNGVNANGGNPVPGADDGGGFGGRGGRGGGGGFGGGSAAAVAVDAAAVAAAAAAPVPAQPASASA